MQLLSSPPSGESQVRSVRRASRVLLRELGFLDRGWSGHEPRDAGTDPGPTHTQALVEIGGHRRLAQGDLAALLRLDKSTTSRVVADLVARGWVRAVARRDDKRARELTLTPRGRAKLALVDRHASARVAQALDMLDDRARDGVVSGLLQYARVLEKSRRRAELELRPIRVADRAGVAHLIRTVMPEFGAKGPGFAILDPEVDDMFGAYRGPKAAYWVLARGKEIVGGAGFAPLVGGDPKTCELRKMYFTPEVRGLGLGQILLHRCLEGAKKARFRQMYIETLGNMTAARALYERNGFAPLERPLGDTGHFGCNAFYLKTL